MAEHDSGSALERLEALIGRWKTQGWTAVPSGVAAERIDAVDTYERLPGEALLHLVDAKVWTRASDKDRFTGTFNDEHDIITGHWEGLDDVSTWQPWMDITVTRERGAQS
jgi:hypothetical protein